MRSSKVLPLSQQPHLLAALLVNLAVACGDDSGPVGGDGVGGGNGGNGGDAASTGGQNPGGQNLGGVGGGGGAACVPGTEICDGEDNDCDDEVDEAPLSCDCLDGETRSCYSGRAGTADIGDRVEGTQSCEKGMWGTCMGEVVPQDEACGGGDEDCDGSFDDVSDVTCGMGACAVTVPGCTDGAPSVCVPGDPSTELCDGVDNNCNGVSDESDPLDGTACSTGLPGSCAAGIYACDSASLICVQTTVPMAEVCDGVDNDCNSVIDDFAANGGPCITGLPGVCSAGAIACTESGGVYTVECAQITAASTEVCDGVDNDCDGIFDNGNPGGGAACDTGQQGICQPGTTSCVNGAIACERNEQPSPEVCDNQDNDCNGQIDDGNPGGGASCSCGGTITCANGSLTCLNQSAPTVFFEEDFSDNAAVWSVGNNWSIGPLSFLLPMARADWVIQRRTTHPPQTMG